MKKGNRKTKATTARRKTIAAGKGKAKGKSKSMPTKSRGGSLKAKVASMVGDSPNSILTLILNDHGALRDSIKVLKDLNTEEDEMQRHLQRFLGYLELHAKSEEATLYSRLTAEEDLHKEILESFEEHNIADHLANELKGANFATAWSEEIAARAKVLAELVEHHAQEEEEVLFPEVRRLLSKEELESLGDTYREKRAEFVELIPESELEFPMGARPGRVSERPQIRR
jgi:hemerythrin-like domain-containing protein